MIYIEHKEGMAEVYNPTVSNHQAATERSLYDKDAFRYTLIIDDPGCHEMLWGRSCTRLKNQCLPTALEGKPRYQI